VKKRSVRIDGHRTSVSVEEPFWQAVLDIAGEQKRSLADLLTEIDHQRPSDQSLSSAIRTFALAWHRSAGGR
jgi:predicted DNA-binding ribbon-helix-helix protein